MYGTPRRADNV
jgi:hypothetical protein